MYYNFGSTTFVTPVGLAGARFNDDEHVVKAGVNLTRLPPATDFT
jgi:hypothetical protein